MTQSNGNWLIIASAGSGKTTFLVEKTLPPSNRKTAILTYTNNNIDEIKKKYYEKNGGIPRSVDVATWYTFLLHQCARPYQRAVYSKRRLKTIHFPKGRSVKGVPYSEIERYYFRNSDEIYSDKISRFIIDCEERSGGLMTRRLASIYDEILIDEFQDLSGYDLDLLGVFLRTGIRMVIVGDPRQCTYTTNNSAKNSQYCGMGILKLARKWEQENLCQIRRLARSFRCNQIICDYADGLWPNMEKTTSLNNNITEHDGLFVVSSDNVHNYVKKYRPVLLRYDKKSESFGYRAINFGNAKGLEFDRVLIIPHGPIKKYIQSGDVNDVKQSLEKFYVAVTRAKQSVAFIYDGKCKSGYMSWYPGD